jgi:phosphoglycerate dehydrogenase-like enzyme
LNSAAAPESVRCLIVGRLPEPDLDLVLARAGGGHIDLVAAPLGREAEVPGRFDCIWRLFEGRLAGVRRNPLADALVAHPEVRWVHSVSAGVDSFGDALSGRPDIVLTNSAGVVAIPIAEFVVGCLLHHCKRLAEIWAAQRDSSWKSFQLRELGDLKVVILGFGAIGQQLARRLQPFGCQVTAVRRHPQTGAAGLALEVSSPDRLAEACLGADALVLAAPLTDETRGVVSREVLSALNQDACLINIARGGLIDEPELLAAVRGGTLTAYLDAFVEEPLPKSSPLWTTPGIFLSPHISWSSPNFARRTCELFGDQLRRFCEGHELLNRVDLRAGY